MQSLTLGLRRHRQPMFGQSAVKTHLPTFVGIHIHVHFLPALLTCTFLQRLLPSPPLTPRPSGQGSWPGEDGDAPRPASQSVADGCRSVWRASLPRRLGLDLLLVLAAMGPD